MTALAIGIGRNTGVVLRTAVWSFARFRLLLVVIGLCGMVSFVERTQEMGYA